MAIQEMVIGVDIGGTKVAAGCVSADGKMSHVRQAKMPSEGSAEDALLIVLGVVNDVRSEARKHDHEIMRIGIGAPGPLNPIYGVILNPPNLPYWRDFELVEKMHSATGLEVRLENDANAAALAEARWGAGVGHSHVFYATFGTGIGTGYIIDGKIFHGASGLAPEGGHATIDRNGPLCGCGKRGCIEAIASGTGLVRRAKEQGRGKKGIPISAEMIFTSAPLGLGWAKEMVDDACTAVGIWLGNIVDLLAPDVIVFGGGMGLTYLSEIEKIREALTKWSIHKNTHDIPIVPARYGVESGIAGAGALWWV